jgi:hypothetical protein
VGDLDLQGYLTAIVYPTIAEFEADETSVRRAFLACIVTFHAIDYLSYPKGPSALRGKFRRESRAFSVVDRVAHAIKHVNSGDARAPRNRQLKPEQVVVRPPGFSDVGFCDISRSDDTVGGITLDNERELDLLVVVRDAAAFLARQIDSSLVTSSPIALANERT